MGTANCVVDKPNRKVYWVIFNMASGNRHNCFVAPKDDRAVQCPFCAQIVVVYSGLHTSHMISLVGDENRTDIRFVDTQNSPT
jgi:hypothetical protein